LNMRSFRVGELIVGSHTNTDRKCLDFDSITLVLVYDQGIWVADLDVIALLSKCTLYRAVCTCANCKWSSARLK
jgi:hypothetical protein